MLLMGSTLFFNQFNYTFFTTHTLQIQPTIRNQKNETWKIVYISR